ncbi:MAG: hypothetical protein II488_04965, partial [Firmicutes bacterium]|nr:hypothetical protein [Bacillota bacterium]
GLVQLHDVFGRPGRAAAAPARSHLYIGNFVRVQAHQRAAIGVQLYGEAASSSRSAGLLLEEEGGLDADEISEITEELFESEGLISALKSLLKKAAPKKASRGGDEIPQQADGSSIESITAKWITADSVDNGDSGLLYYKPSGDSSFSVRLQINYSLSGEHPYEPGDVTITIPVSIIRDRLGKDYSETIIPYPEDPSVKADFNWKQIGDSFVLTNTKRMSAATKGYIQFAFDGLVPHELVDMQVSEPFDAYIEVVTHAGNTIALRSNELTAQFDTEAKITSLSKKVYGSVQRVPASSIPESQRVEGGTEYIKVNWYVWGVIDANTLYVLDQADTIEDEYSGFVIGATSEDGLTIEKSGVYRGSRDGQTNYYYFSSAYPASQFEPDTDYIFHNNASFTVSEVDPEAEVTNSAVQDSDPALVTTREAGASVKWRYTDPKWIDPSGHYMVVKNGNDDKAGRNRTRHMRFSERDDTHIWKSASEPDGWYGVYPSALNEMQEGSDILLSYTIDSVGYVMPWMFDSASYEADGELAPRRSVNYSRPVTMV